MARLSKRQSVHVSFLLHKLAISYDQQQRDDLLTAILDALHIDDEQRAESAASAKRSIRFDADKKRRGQRPAKPASADDIDSMSRDDLRTYIDELRAKRDRLLAEREKRPDIDAMTDEERQAYQDHLMRSIAAKLEPTPSTPEPSPTVEEAATYDVTAKQRRALAAFDDMSDADQIDQLASLWGNDGKAVQP